MCDQTEVIYAPGDVVWVKLGAGVWWPSQVQDYDQLPQDIIGNLRKRPIAVVKFFQEDAFEYVKNLDQIYHYNCRKKHEFIKKGLDMCRSSNRNVPSNMKMFPNDVTTAEHLTHGDPNILDSAEFQPQQKEDYRELFGSSKKPASTKKQPRPEWRIRSLGDGGGGSPTNGRRQSGTTTPHRQSGTTPRPVTHPRFINKALGRGSDHEVRIRSQSEQRLLQSSGKLYNCHLCGFSASRINVIILHNKSHSAGYADAFLPSQPGGKKAKKRSMSEKRPNVDGSPPVKRKAESDDLKSSGKDAAASPSPVKKPIFGRKRSAKDKADKAAKEKRQTEEFRDNLLKDWDDDDNEEGVGDNGSSKGKGTDDPALAVDDSKEQQSSAKLDDSKSTPSKETSCFDFDDSEDGIKLEETIMQFGRKIPRLLGDRKKRTDDMEVERDGEVTRVEVREEPLSHPEESGEEERKRRENKKAKEEFDAAFKALLAETMAPVIPDAFTSNDKMLVKTCEAVNDGSIEPDPPEDVSNEDVAMTTKVDRQHFLVKMSGAVATTSPDKQTSETNVTACDADYVANTSVVNHAENVVETKSTPSKETSCFEAIVEEVVTESEEVVDFKIDETIVTTEKESVLTEERPTDSTKSRGFLSSTERESVLLEESPTDSPKSRGFLSASQRESVLPEERPTGSPKSRGFLSTSKREIVLPEERPTDSPKSRGFLSTTETESVLPEESPTDSPKSRRFLSTTERESVLPEERPTDSPISRGFLSTTETESVLSEERPKSQGFLSNDFVDDCIIDNYSSKEKPQQSSGLIEIVNQPKPISSESGLPGEMQIIVVTSNADTSKTVSDVNNMYQEMDFDIDSMPVIIGDDLSQDDHQLQQGAILKAVEAPQNVLQNHHHPQFPLIKPKPSPRKAENKVVTVITSSGQLSKMNQSELKPVTKTAVVKRDQPTLVRIPTSTSNKITRKVILSPTKKSNSGAIRIAAASSSQVGKLTSPLAQVGGKLKSPLAGKLTVPGGLLTQKVSSAGKLSVTPKGIVQSTAGSGQVLILKSTTPPGTASKTSLQKMIQPAGGNKVLILTSAQGGASGQKVLGTLAPQSKTITGTRFLTTKGSVVVGKGAGNTSQKILIDKSGAISQAPKSVIIDKSSLSAAFSKSNTASSSDSMSSKLTLGTSKASSSTFPISGNKGVILTPIASKGDNTKLRLIASKTSGSASSTTGAKLVLSTLPSKSQPLKLITKGQPNSSSTILIQTNQGVLATSSFPGTMQNQTVISSKPGTAFVAATSKAQILHSSSINNMLQTQNKKLVIPKKSASPNILQKSQKKPVQRVTKKNFITNQTSVLTAAPAQPSTSSPITTTAQDMLLLPSMKNMPQGTILQGTTVDSEGRKSYVYLTVDEHGNYRPLESSPLLDLAAASTSESEASSSSSMTQTSTTSQQTVYYDPGNADLDNLLLAIDEAGNVVNVVPPQTDSGHSGYGQDILAKALADTQVLQPETTATDLGCVLVESLPPAPTLSHNVLETSSTLNQTPIMTPLEMPSAVSSLQIQSKFLKNNPSMPLLLEDSAKPASDTMFVTSSDGSSSGNPLAFQLSIGADNNIIVTSSAADISTSLAAFMCQPAATEATNLSDPATSTSNNVKHGSLAAFMCQPAATETNLAATSNKTVEEAADNNIIVTSSAADISTSLAAFMCQPAANETTILSDPSAATSSKNVEQGALAAFMCQPAATEATIVSDPAAATSSNNEEQLPAFMCQPVANETTILSDAAAATSSNNEEQLPAFMSEPAATEATILSDAAGATSSQNEEQLSTFMSQPAATEATILSDPATVTSSNSEEQLDAFMSQPAATESTILSDPAATSSNNEEQLAAFMCQPAATEATILSDPAAATSSQNEEQLPAFMSQPVATEATILSDPAATSSNNEEQLPAFMSQPAATEATILSDAAGATSSQNEEQLSTFMSQPAATEATILSDPAAATSSNNEEQLGAFMCQPVTETTILSDDTPSNNEEQGLTAAVKQLVTDSSADAFAAFHLTEDASKKDDYSETTMDSAASSCGKSEFSTFNIEETSASSSFDLNRTKVATSEDDLFNTGSNQHTSNEQR